MKIDITIKNLLEYGDIFADIANVNLFGGRQVLQPQDLRAMPTESSYRDMEGEFHTLLRDCFQEICRQGKCIGYIGYEVQMDISNIMPVRNMGYAYTAYMKQIRAIMAQNKRNGCPAFTRGLHNGQTLLPVITCVLYLGTQPWKAPLSLSDMMNITNEWQSLWKEIIENYSIHVISIVKQPKEIRIQYQSDFRIIADYLAYYDDEKGLTEEWMQNRQSLVHPEQTLDLLAALSGDKRMQDMKKALIQRERKEDANMCLLMDIIERDYKEKGLAEGREKGRIEGRAEGRKEGRVEGIRGAIQLLQRLGIDETIILHQISLQFSLPVDTVKTYL